MTKGSDPPLIPGKEMGKGVEVDETGQVRLCCYMCFRRGCEGVCWGRIQG